ncbi:MAG: acyl dehydratase, partial [Deltaproteobacteria bacterium]|nr:acyl dehydratase [Deltaproteobacteria bacterium]
GESKAVRRGVEFALHTEASVEGEVCWRAETNVLVPGVGKVEKRAEAAGEVATEPVRSLTQEWTVPADQGRRYAKVSGDYNPIHLTALTARPFGFPRAIVHGMWTLARASAALHEETVGRGGAWTLTCAFKKPLLLPSRVQFASGTEQGGTEAGPGGGGGVGFEVKDSKGAQLIVGNLAGALAQATGA